MSVQRALAAAASAFLLNTPSWAQDTHIDTPGPSAASAVSEAANKPKFDGQTGYRATNVSLAIQSALYQYNSDELSRAPLSGPLSATDLAVAFKGMDKTHPVTCVAILAVTKNPDGQFHTGIVFTQQDAEGNYQTMRLKKQPEPPLAIDDGSITLTLMRDMNIDPDKDMAVAKRPLSLHVLPFPCSIFADDPK